MKKIIALVLLVLVFASFVRADFYDENCNGDCFACGCPEGYYCEPENRSCAEIDDFDLVFVNEQDLTEEEQKVFNEVLEPLGGIQEFKQIPLSLLKTSEVIVFWSGFRFGFGLDWLGKPKIEFVESTLEQ